jgi:hypothetical protein
MLQGAVLLLETVDKRKMLLGEYKILSSEATSSLPSRGLFLWLEPLLREGSRKALVLKDLMAIHENLDPHKVRLELSAAWRKSYRQRRHALAFATLRAWKWEFAKIVFPRLVIVLLSILQPFVITAVVENVLAKDSLETRNKGYGLIGAVALTYFGTAVCIRPSITDIITHNPSL